MDVLQLRKWNRRRLLVSMFSDYFFPSRSYCTSDEICNRIFEIHLPCDNPDGREILHCSSSVFHPLLRLARQYRHSCLKCPEFSTPVPVHREVFHQHLCVSSAHPHKSTFPPPSHRPAGHEKVPHRHSPTTLRLLLPPDKDIFQRMPDSGTKFFYRRNLIFKRNGRMLHIRRVYFQKRFCIIFRCSAYPHTILPLPEFLLFKI